MSPIGDEHAASKSGDDARARQVASRVEARWDALIKGDVDASYAFLSPVTRETVTLDEYRKHTRKSGFRKAEIRNIACDSDACTVQLWVTYDVSQMKGVQTPVTEKWVFENGQAWYVYRG